MSEFESGDYGDDFQSANYSDVSGSMEMPAFQGKGKHRLTSIHFASLIYWYKFNLYHINYVFGKLQML